MAKTSTKPGRPERSKVSYANEIQRLKKQLTEAQGTIQELVKLTEEQYKESFKYVFPSIKQRIKYLIKGEI